MKVFDVTETNIDILAAFMAAAKPDWWPHLEDAKRQVEHRMAWYMGTEERTPEGFASVIDFPGYKTYEIDVMGCVCDGAFHVDGTLDPILERVEDEARKKGYVNIRFIISSSGTSIHGCDASDPLTLLDGLHSEREDYVWLISQGFRIYGVLPHVYDKGRHGIVLIKSMM